MATIEKMSEITQKGFVELLSLDDGLFNLLIEIISKSELTSHPINIVKYISSSTEADFGDVEGIIRCISRFISARDQNSVSTEEIIDDLIRIIKSGLVKELTYNEELEEILKKRLSMLLNNRQLYFASKSLDLLTEYENIFISARILSDIRPIFSQSVEKPLEAGMITHLLHIHYHHGDQIEHKDLYLALDANDLKSLKETIEREEAKIKSLNSIFEKSGIKNLKIGE